MSALGGSALVGGVVFAKELWHYWKPRKIGVYGPTMAGKTTLDRYMTTPGEMEKLIKSAGRQPRQRTTSYGYVSDLQHQRSLGASELAEPIYASAEKYERKSGRKKSKLVRPGLENLGGEEKITSADIV